jgi:alanine racemase
MARAATATINLDAFRHNYLLAKSMAPDQRAIAIIKANGYGHGAVELAKFLEADADAFGVACIEEAVELREAGINAPILLLEGFFSADELDYISTHNLWCAVHSAEQIDQIAATRLTAPINVWLKMDSGMHRLGMAPEAIKPTFEQLNALPQINEVVLMTHFACADELDKDATAKQIQVFDNATAGLAAASSLANSAGTLAHPQALRAWQRPGIMLYGATPFPEPQINADKLKAVMTLSSEIIAIRDLEPGEAVGYGRTWICDKPTRVGTVAMGYADGYPRHAQNGTPVIVDGQRTQLIGRVSMDMLTVDLSHLPDANIGSTVELWGDNLPAAEVAPYCGTIPYTLFTGITRRLHKRYI